MGVFRTAVWVHSPGPDWQSYYCASISQTKATLREKGDPGAGIRTNIHRAIRDAQPGERVDIGGGYSCEKTTQG